MKFKSIVFTGCIISSLLATSAFALGKTVTIKMSATSVINASITNQGNQNSTAPLLLVTSETSPAFSSAPKKIEYTGSVNFQVNMPANGFANDEITYGNSGSGCVFHVNSKPGSPYFVVSAMRYGSALCSLPNPKSGALNIGVSINGYGN